MGWTIWPSEAIFGHNSPSARCPSAPAQAVGHATKAVNQNIQKSFWPGHQGVKSVYVSNEPLQDDVVLGIRVADCKNHHFFYRRKD